MAGRARETLGHIQAAEGPSVAYRQTLEVRESPAEQFSCRGGYRELHWAPGRQKRMLGKLHPGGQ